MAYDFPCICIKLSREKTGFLCVFALWTVIHLYYLNRVCENAAVYIYLRAINIYLNLKRRFAFFYRFNLLQAFYCTNLMGKNSNTLDLYLF